MKNNNNETDCSFIEEKLFSYDTKLNDLNTEDNFTVKEATHIYVTQQRIHHLFADI